MKVRVTTKITTTYDIDTQEIDHQVDLVDEDRLSEVSTDLLGGLVLGGLRATQRAVRQQYPRAAAAETRVEATESGADKHSSMGDQDQPDPPKRKRPKTQTGIRQRQG